MEPDSHSEWRIINNTTLSERERNDELDTLRSRIKINNTTLSRREILYELRRSQMINRSAQAQNDLNAIEKRDKEAKQLNEINKRLREEAEIKERKMKKTDSHGDIVKNNKS